jgi:diadenosine tetraphosphate (Ap4A) HIT family hydrolase
MFELHSQLAKDCAVVGDLELCRVLLMNDAQYPWLILVPRRAEVTELFQLGPADLRRLFEEVSAAAAAMAGHFRADKMNVAALGNVVPQLHVHVIVRRQSDPAWPRPVWGARPTQPYADEVLAARIAELVELLQPLDLQASHGL